MEFSEHHTEKYCTNCKHNGIAADYKCGECQHMDKWEHRCADTPQTEEPKWTKENCKGCKYNEYPYDDGTCFVRVCIDGNKYEPKQTEEVVQTLKNLPMEVKQTDCGWK